MARQNPWDYWIPGVLSKRQIKELCDQGHISGFPNSGPKIGYSSIDLHLSSNAYKMTCGSIKPSGERYSEYLKAKHGFIKKINPDINEHFVLKARETYVFKLKEQLNISKGKIFGQATAKSSIGRVDVLARLIVDGMDRYDYFDYRNLDSAANLYVEITPITFDVCVKENICITQLRLILGSPEDSIIANKDELYTPILLESEKSNGTLAVDLSPAKIAGQEVVAFCAERDDVKDQPIKLWIDKSNTDSRPDPRQYWKFIKSESSQLSKSRLRIKQNAFYILRSKEKIAIPNSVAVYCRAMDETFGEMRIHYAGFVHPYFGLENNEARGTPLIFEVRGHDVDVSLGDGEPLAKLIFYRMSENAMQDDDDDAYNNQTLKLSNLFRDWPSKVKLDEEGRVV